MGYVGDFTDQMLLQMGYFYMVSVVTTDALPMMTVLRSDEHNVMPDRYFVAMESFSYKRLSIVAKSIIRVVIKTKVRYLRIKT